MSASPTPTVPATFLPPEDSQAIANQAIVHLHLLYIFHKLRLQVGSQDGLWGIWDDRLEHHYLSAEEHAQGLAKLKEKRWSIYLARAVHRYGAWWTSMGITPLTEQDTHSTHGSRYATFTRLSNAKQWTPGNMIPIDVLMVWHTHMLNPRLYLEDTMRKGRGDIWASGLPWDMLTQCLANDQFDYQVLETSKMAWTSATGLSWYNEQDSMHAEVTCPSCRAATRFPWTTCDFQYSSSPATASGSRQAPTSSDTQLQERLNIIGHGLADGRPLQNCQSCHDELDADYLCFYKFVQDGHSLTRQNHTMPGTLLDPVSGRPELEYADHISKSNAPLTAPNRLTRRVLYAKANDMLWKYRDGEAKPTMGGLRAMARREMHDPFTLAAMAGDQAGKRVAELGEDLQRKLENKFKDKAEQRKAVYKMISDKTAIVVRRMLAHYADNWSPFSLDLRAAMLRQSLFIDKMYKFDWLHGVDPQATIVRAVNKYARFLQIAKENPRRMVVPTLDVDLAWHTHQLSPQSYYNTTTQFLSKFLDHNDKVDENKLSQSFEWMCETYYQKYDEHYAECVCWYCEVIRASQTNTLSMLLGKSKRQKSFKDLRDQFKDTDPSDIGPHLSAHCAVKVPFPVKFNLETRDLYVQHTERRKRGMARAGNLVKKHENGPPPKEERIDHWGYSYPLAGPWVCPLFFDATMYPSSIARPPAGSGINADDNIGGCVTGCGSLARCGVSTSSHPFSGALDAAGIITDVHGLADSGGDGGGGCGGCGGGD